LRHGVKSAFLGILETHGVCCCVGKRWLVGLRELQRVGEMPIDFLLSMTELSRLT
jgi:hypothetical protein